MLCGLVLVAVVAAAQGESIAEQEQDVIQSYLSLMFQRLESHKRYPTIAKRNGLSGRVVLRFTVRWDGEVVNPQVTEATGHDSFREATLQALTRVGQLPPFPDEIRRRELLVEVPITYQIEDRSSLGMGVVKRELWRCFAPSDYNKITPLFTLTRMRIGGKDIGGEVSVAGVTHLAWFKVAGLNRRWDFDYNERRETFRYALIIEPDGSGRYYNFSNSSDGSAKASQLFKCVLLP